MAYTTIKKPSDYFNTKIYTGNSSTLSVTGVGFQPDWTWIKERSSTSGHEVYDSTRGATKLLSPNTTDAEGTNASALTSFDSDGFSVGSGGAVNENSQTYVGWNWKANAGSTSSNSDGSITSTVQANTTAGFSIVTYTGTNVNGATVGHGLGKVPDIVLTKNRSTSGYNWLMYHSANTSAPETDALLLNSNSGTLDSEFWWNDTAPTSSVFSLSQNGGNNDNGNNYIAYCFNSVEGYSKFGKYTGNGSTDGTFVYTGFRPAWVLLKATSGTESWELMDNKRLGYNGGTGELRADVANAETTTNQVDFLSNGFKPRTTAGQWNSNGTIYIYLAFAESPFVTSTGVPVTAR